MKINEFLDKIGVPRDKADKVVRVQPQAAIRTLRHYEAKFGYSSWFVKTYGDSIQVRFKVGSDNLNDWLDAIWDFEYFTGVTIDQIDNWYAI